MFTGNYGMILNWQVTIWHS